GCSSSSGPRSRPRWTRSGATSPVRGVTRCARTSCTRTRWSRTCAPTTRPATRPPFSTGRSTPSSRPASAGASRLSWELADMHISAAGDYAVRAAVALAAAHPGTVSAQALATEQDMPRKFLETILADLRRAGLVHSTRGVDGGYTLARPPTEIMVGDVLRAADGPLAGVRGMRPEEASYDGTAAHPQALWGSVPAAVRPGRDEVSLAEVAKGRLPAHVRKLIADQEAWQPR